jgi:imidazole glycerol phosphate synthase subunit HisF
VLVASMVHFGDYRCSQLKQGLADAGLPMRMRW